MGIVRVICLLIALATVLQVKDTGKSRERVNPVEVLSAKRFGCVTYIEASKKRGMT